MNERNLSQITPMLQVKDMAGAVRFFVDVLGFHAWVHAHDYAYVQREGVAVRLLLCSPDAIEQMNPGARAFLFYVDVKDVAALVDEISPKLLAAGLPAGQGPVDQTWGQREWWVTGPEGGLIVFGQEVVAMPFHATGSQIARCLPSRAAGEYAWGRLVRPVLRLTGREADERCVGVAQVFGWGRRSVCASGQGAVAGVHHGRRRGRGGGAGVEQVQPRAHDHRLGAD